MAVNARIDPITGELVDIWDTQDPDRPGPTFTEDQVNAEADRLLGKPSVAIAFVDLETTGLDPDYHDVWEIAIVRREADGTEQAWSCQLSVDGAKADPEALIIGQFAQRRLPSFGWFDRQAAVAEVRRLTKDAVVVGQNPGFDVAFLRRLLMLLPGEDPPWHYRPICVTTLAAGWIASKLDRPQDFGGLDLPWSSRAIAELVDVDVSKFEKHTAMGDARLAAAIFDAVMG